LRNSPEISVIYYFTNVYNSKFRVAVHEYFSHIYKTEPEGRYISSHNLFIMILFMAILLCCRKLILISLPKVVLKWKKNNSEQIYFPKLTRWFQTARRCQLGQTLTHATCCTKTTTFHEITSTIQHRQISDKVTQHRCFRFHSETNSSRPNVFWRITPN
jgi:hypothetical protein